MSGCTISFLVDSRISNIPFVSLACGSLSTSYNSSLVHGCPLESYVNTFSMVDNSVSTTSGSSPTFLEIGGSDLVVLGILCVDGI